MEKNKNIFTAKTPRPQRKKKKKNLSLLLSELWVFAVRLLDLKSFSPPRRQDRKGRQTSKAFVP